MPNYPPPVGAAGGLPPFWNAIMQAIGGLQAQANASSSQPTVYADQYGNVQLIIGQLNQVVTIGASSGVGGFSGTAGVQVGTGLTAVAGLAYQTGLVTTTVTLTQGSASATVASATGLLIGMQIGAAMVNDPATGVATSAITPGTTISNIAGTTVTLSQAAAESGTGLVCAACRWVQLNTYIIAGTVSAAGVIVSGTGFTVAHNSTGNYTVTFTVPFETAPAVTVTPIAPSGNAAFCFLVSAPTVSAANIGIVNSSEVFTNTEFSFIATG